MSREGPPSTRDREATPLGPIIGSMLAVVAWLIFILVYALFWSKGFDLFQNIIVTIFSLMIMGILIGVMWMIWGYRRFGGFSDWWD